MNSYVKEDSDKPVSCQLRTISSTGVPIHLDKRQDKIGKTVPLSASEMVTTSLVKKPHDIAAGTAVKELHGSD